MQSDPIQEWKRLTEHYRQMGDEELHELAFEFFDLTDTAQQALRSEMRCRGLGDPQAASNEPKFSGCSKLNRPRSVFSPSSPLSESADRATANAEDAVSRKNIRRLPLCQCDDWKQAWQICQALRKKSIESWIQDSRPYVEDSLVFSPDMGPPPALLSPYGFRVLVAADQLGEAREIAAQPIPRAIINESEQDLPEFTPPKCPKCGAEDPVLVAVDPVNAWRCEQCDEEWTESDKPCT